MISGYLVRVMKDPDWEDGWKCLSPEAEAIANAIAVW